MYSHGNVHHSYSKELTMSWSRSVWLFCLDITYGQSESDMIEYVSLRDWPYVMSRQNNQTERDQLMVNSLLYEWCTFHGYRHVAVRAAARERCLMNRSQNARSWSACSWLLYCSTQRVMFRPCTHMSDHVHMVQSESDMIEYVSLRDWPYVMSRQNNQTERDQLMV